MTTEPANEPKTTAFAGISQRLKALSGVDLFSYISLLIGCFAVAVLFGSAFVFSLYLYNPIFNPVDAVFIITPSINYDLLNNTLKELQKREEEMQDKLEKTYPDPFSEQHTQPPSFLPQPPIITLEKEE